MTGRRRHLAAAAVAIALLAGCSTSTPAASEPSTPTSPPVPSESPADAESSPERDGDGNRVIPPLNLPAQAPGTDEAYAELRADLDRFLTDEQRADGVPWPELRNPDPAAAYRSTSTFQNWMAENNNASPLVEAYTAPGSPERGWDTENFADWNALGLLALPNDPPYSMNIDGVYHPAATDITDGLLAQVPPGSAAVVYWDTVGPSRMALPDGTVLYEAPGWVNKGPWVAIMAPTDVGWQVWWDELTDTPPIGTQDRGNPVTPPLRQDV